MESIRFPFPIPPSLPDTTVVVLLLLPILVLRRLASYLHVENEGVEQIALAPNSCGLKTDPGNASIAKAKLYGS